MAKTLLINPKNKAPVDIAKAGSSWIMGATKSIVSAADNDVGLDIMTGADNVRLTLLGDIRMTGASASGIRIGGYNDALTIGATSSINATYAGVMVDTVDAARVTVTGIVKGGQVGLESMAGDLSLAVGKTGMIAGTTAISSGTGSDSGGFVAIRNSGQILAADADHSAINVKGAYTQITNSGQITGDIQSNTQLQLVNTGTINGDVFGGGGTDYIKSTVGTITGSLRGGPGDDTYVIKPDMIANIIETAAGGKDTIKTVAGSAPIVLINNVENLFLLGKVAGEVTGNASDNIIKGNGGADMLSGLAGKDIIYGGAGNDILVGGSGDDFLWGDTGKDIVVFTTVDGLDTVLFEDGMDRIDLSNAGIAGGDAAAKFAALDIDPVLDANNQPVAGHFTITFDAANQITIIGSGTMQLDITDFIF